MIKIDRFIGLNLERKADQTTAILVKGVENLLSGLFHPHPPPPTDQNLFMPLVRKGEGGGDCEPCNLLREFGH